MDMYQRDLPRPSPDLASVFSLGRGGGKSALFPSSLSLFSQSRTKLTRIRPQRSGLGGKHDELISPRRHVRAKAQTKPPRLERGKERDEQDRQTYNTYIHME